ncbi:uncharacterized protein LOC110893441 [Helianthus annuus]|uniref:uncharacterized protein LOC110893441 n=1 Tax=Helianthus annuus TaxID=4232 RepID=UPI000B8F0010|nr:uncharacterized protein LOC110893441 [Helianthus annuus]
MDNFMSYGENLEGMRASSSTKPDNEATDANKKPMSFASVVPKKKDMVKVNFRHLEANEQMEGVDVVITMSSVKEVSERYANTLYGYFLGKRLAFPVVDYFARNNWSKYVISKFMMNAKGFSFFKFKTKEGMDKLLKDGPWLIKNVQIILNEWSPAITVMKEDINTIPVWVKIHDIPLAAFTEDGLSLLASKIDLKRNVTIAVPGLNGNGYSKVDVKVEYDWEPSRCLACCVFGHEESTCPKNPIRQDNNDSKEQNDGYTEVTRKKGSQQGNNNKNQKPQQGVQLKNQKPKMVYRPIPKNKSSGGATSSSQICLSNTFDVLQDGDGIKTATRNPSSKPDSSNKGGKGITEEVFLDENEFEVDDLLTEIPKSMARKSDDKNPEGASTPGYEVSNGVVLPLGI